MQHAPTGGLVQWGRRLSSSRMHACMRRREGGHAQGPRPTLTMSGCAVMICASGASESLPLYFRSPIARDRFRLPFTLRARIGESY